MDDRLIKSVLIPLSAVTLYSEFHAASLKLSTMLQKCLIIRQQENPADARVTRDSAVIPRGPSAAILDFIEPEITPFHPPTPKIIA